MRESDLQTKCIKYLKNKGYYVLNQHGGGWGNKGCPDLIACIKGRFVAFELKVGENRMHVDQAIHKKLIEKAHGHHHLVRSIEQLKTIIDYYEEGF